MPSRFLSRAALAASSVTLALASAAQAERIDLGIFENADGADVSELDLWLDVLPAGADQVDFVFHNDSAIPSIITAVYVEASDFATLALAAPQIVSQSAGVSFAQGATPPSPAGSIQFFGGDWNSLYTADADSPAPAHGINAGLGETLTLRFDLVGGATPGDIVAAITDDPARLRIAQHIQALPGGSSVWSVTVPSPGVLTLLSAGGLVLAARRRR